MTSDTAQRPQVALFPFKTGGLWVRGELLGASWLLERDGYGLIVVLPSDQSDFRQPPEKEALFRIGISQGDDAIAATINVFQVAVLVESTTSPANPPRSEGSDGQQALTKALSTATAVAEDFLAWLRVLGGQFWLGASHEPIQPAGTADLIDLETGQRIKNIGREQGVVLYGLGEDAALDQHALDQIVGCLNEERRAKESGILLADARDTLGGSGAESATSASRRDVRRAVLLAAIASEMKIRETLREKTPAHRKELVSVILKNWREVDIAIAQLPHKAMKAAVGHSLHDESPGLFKQVEKLFGMRNDIAHRGEIPSLAEAKEAVSTAIKLAVWLDSLFLEAADEIRTHDLLHGN